MTPLFQLDDTGYLKPYSLYLAHDFSYIDTTYRGHIGTQLRRS